MPTYRGVTAYAVMGHSRSRVFGPEVGGLYFNNADVTDYSVFRIDHDQAFQQTTHIQYQPMKNGPWFGFNWRYDSGMVAGGVPFAPAGAADQPIDLTYLTADQQAQIKLTCDRVTATLSNPLTSCAPNELTSSLVRIPAPGTQDPDKNPARIAPRHLFDIATGWDNIFHRDRYQTNLTFTVLNVANKVALYNYLSTFSGTHFVPPRSFSGELSFNF